MQKPFWLNMHPSHRVGVVVVVEVDVVVEVLVALDVDVVVEVDVLVVMGSGPLHDQNPIAQV